jgi:hypothetical protein
MALAIVFVNLDTEPHHLVIKSNADGQQVFDAGELESNDLFLITSLNMVTTQLYPLHIHTSKLRSMVIYVR